MLVFAVIAGLALLGILILSVPFDLAFKFERDTELRKRLRLTWLFGLVGLDLGGGSPRSRQRQPQKEASRGEAEKPGASRRRANFRVPLALFGTRGFPQRLYKLVRTLLRSIKVWDLKAQIRIGLDDPAQTGWLFATVWPIVALIPNSNALDIKIEPDYSDAVLEGYGQGRMRIFPIRLLGLVIWFACSITTLRAARAALKA